MRTPENGLNRFTMGKGLRVNGEKLRQIISEAGYDADSDTDLQAFCTKVAKVSLTTLKRWLSNGGIHEDSLRELAERLPVKSWHELRTKKKLIFRAAGQRPSDNPFAVTLHVFDEEWDYQVLCDELVKLIRQHSDEASVFLARVEAGSIIVTLYLNDLAFDWLLYYFNDGFLKRFSVRQIDLTPQTVRLLPEKVWGERRYEYAFNWRGVTIIGSLESLYTNLRFRQLPDETINIRRKRQENPAAVSLHD